MLRGISRPTKLETRTSKIKENWTVYILYTDLKWGIVTDRCGVNCLSDEPSTFHVVQSSALQFALQEDMAPWVTKQQHRKLHDLFTALDRYMKGGNVFLRWRSKLSWISSVKRLWEELLQELDHLGDLLHDRSREEAIKWAVRPCYSVISTVGGIFQVYLPSGLFFTLNKAYWVQHATEGLRWKGSCIRLFV